MQVPIFFGGKTENMVILTFKQYTCNACKLNYFLFKVLFVCFNFYFPNVQSLHAYFPSSKDHTPIPKMLKRNTAHITNG